MKCLIFFNCVVKIVFYFVCFIDMKILQASVHQGDPSFVGRGRQCVTNSIMAIMKSNTHNVDQWTKCDMDDVLKDGDRIYQLIKTKNKLSSEYLLLNELPDVLEGIIVQKSEPKAGLVSRNHTEAPFYHLEGAISSLLSEMPDTDGMLLTVGNTIPSYTGAVIIEKQSKVFYYFDPHSRGDTGMSNSDGKATISSHSNVPSLCLFIKHLTSSLFKAVSDVTFEIAAVKTEKISDYEDDLNYHSSFNESDCESCDLNVVNEKNKRNDLKTKDVQEIPFNNIQPSDSDSSSSFSGFEPVPENELDDKLSKLQMFTDSDEVSSVIDHTETDSNKVNPGTDKTDSHTDENESNAMELIAETVGDINDSFTLLKTIDTEIIENYDGASEDMHSDDSFKDPSYKSPQHETEESTDEDFPLSYFNKRKNFHKSKYGNQGAGDHIKQNAPQESNENIAESASNTEPQSNVNSQPDKEVEGVDENQVHLTENNESLESNNITIEQNVDQSVKRGRKRSRNEDEWKKNITKRRRNQGKSYTAKSGKSVKARVMRKACGHKCKFSCNNKFSEEAREKVFHQYWAIGDISKQRQFLIKFAQRKLKSRGSSENNRKHSITYTLPNLQTGETHRVCKTFFLNTLDVSHQRVSTAHSKQEHLPGVVNNDRRGKMPGSRSNKISEEQLSLVREHIKSFQTIESHYCRKDSNRKYLDPDLSLKKMYELYCKWCATEGTKPVLLHKYREIFNTEFNLGFFQPKKDQCDFCTRYSNATDAERENLSKDYENHIKNKDLARKNKTKDKER